MKIQGVVAGELKGMKVKTYREGEVKIAEFTYRLKVEDKESKQFGTDFHRVAFQGMNQAKPNKDGVVNYSFPFTAMKPKLTCETHWLRYEGNEAKVNPEIKKIEAGKNEPFVIATVGIELSVAENDKADLAVVYALLSEVGNIVEFEFQPVQMDLPIDGKKIVKKTGAYGNPSPEIIQ